MAKFSTTDGSLELHMKCHSIAFYTGRYSLVAVRVKNQSKTNYFFSKQLLRCPSQITFEDILELLNFDFSGAVFNFPGAVFNFEVIFKLNHYS